MSITNCRRCGGIYNKIGRDLCPECLKEEDAAYQVVRPYLRQHPNTYMAQLTEDTGVDEDLVVEMIRDGRLILGNNPNLFYSCENCGAPTQSGKYCHVCAREMSGAFSVASEGLKQRQTGESKERRYPGYYSKH
ncbi:TIGR03826 family flagellar region protein [Alicyclobacillus sp. SO9]|uniref:TIGR03826 family flagellar region protein n=1 Tax=Alicyclobacillus sp. SO9 TaxID=2665646 RepID=UPI0018E7E6D4|nr:TIGR03826 family flagellar region protein [Alicyclobacillus sp. SO9]